MYKNNFQIYKLFNGNWLEISIQNIRKGDLVKVIDIVTGEPLLNKDNGEIDIVICDAYKDENNGWSIQSKPYELEEESKQINNLPKSVQLDLNDPEIKEQCNIAMTMAKAVNGEVNNKEEN